MNQRGPAGTTATLASLLKRGLLIGAMALPLPCLAESGPTWQSLSVRQQQALAPLRQDWQAMDGERKQKWMEMAARFDKMPSAERERIQQRMAEWTRLPAGERTLARQQFQEARTISPDERQARWLQYQALAPEAREQLARQAQQRSAEPNPRGGGTARQAAPQAKTNVVPPVSKGATQAVTPIIVQARPGVTTTTVATQQRVASHQQAGLPKIAATPDFVDPATLLPRRGAQAAARIDPPASAARTTAQ
jgi:DNA segregation ATPase FtsK/SpoIIIE-like protein